MVIYTYFASNKFVNCIFREQQINNEFTTNSYVYEQEEIAMHRDYFCIDCFVISISCSANLIFL